MLHNSHRPMEYASTLYYNHQNDRSVGDSNFTRYNLEPCNRDSYAYNTDRVDNYHRDVTALYHANTISSGKQQSHAFADKLPECGPAIADFNANVTVTPQNLSPEAASPPAYGNNVADNPIKPALPTFPWMSYSSEDGKRKRQSYSRRQTLELEKEFRYSEYLTKKRRSELCHMLQLSEKQIKTWFQNRRMKKKKEKEKHFDLPKLHEPDIPVACAVTPMKTESQDYAWDKTVVATSPCAVIADEPFKANQRQQFVPDTSHVYFNTPYEMNYT